MTEPLSLGPLSHSSASLLLECEQRYAYYKIDKATEDPDYAKPDSLAVGSAFHWILEKSRHEKPASITADLEHCSLDPDIRLDEGEFPLVHAMVLKYLRLHRRMGFKVLHVETEIKTSWFHGFVDAIFEDPAGGWWIVDLKTYKSLHLPSLALLPNDPQLNLYAGHAPFLAEIHGLDLDQFKGCRWRVTTKSTARPRKDEPYQFYVTRLADQYIKSYDIPIPKEELKWEDRLSLHKLLWSRTAELFGRPPVRNFKNCMSYYSPCPYWSRCHGKPFSDMQSITERITLEE